MHTELMKVKVSDLFNGYEDNDEDGVFAYSGQLVVRPAYQREFVYADRQRDAVIDSIRQKLPLGLIYWAKCEDGTHEYEVLDGQQRIISICQYLNGDFSINHEYFFNLADEEKDQIRNYELLVYLFDGTDTEKLRWFQRINIAGVVLTNQELLNATYTGPWLSDAKKHFSRRNCAAGQMADGYITGNPIRQDYLEKALGWAADRDNLPSGQDYMALHQHDEDADDLWQYFQEVISWAERLFPKKRKGITDHQDWGLLYNKYKDKSYKSSILESEVQKLVKDKEVTKNSGIIPYLLSDRTKADEKYLSLRGFDEEDKEAKYEEQGGICPVCGKHFELDEMEADHIVPWSKGGKTEYSNLQMLCRSCNRSKGAK